MGKQSTSFHSCLGRSLGSCRRRGCNARKAPGIIILSHRQPDRYTMGVLCSIDPPCIKTSIRVCAADRDGAFCLFSNKADRKTAFRKMGNLSFCLRGLLLLTLIFWIVISAQSDGIPLLLSEYLATASMLFLHYGGLAGFFLNYLHSYGVAGLLLRFSEGGVEGLTIYHSS